MQIFSKDQATELSNQDINYVVRDIGNDEYVVWDCKSDHRVEFDISDEDIMNRALAYYSR